mmetsp:Transcript_7540/g.15750  ORF Transcript_7540/g.15750 Transcript_7540/m.15750 type:complete len:118 (-) Transcript_7540:1099-1452(-)
MHWFPHYEIDGLLLFGLQNSLQMRMIQESFQVHEIQNHETNHTGMPHALEDQGGTRKERHFQLFQPIGTFCGGRPPQGGPNTKPTNDKGGQDQNVANESDPPGIVPRTVLFGIDTEL